MVAMERGLEYDQYRLAMYIGGIQRIERVTAQRIVNEAAGWGMSRRRAEEVVNDFLERIPGAIDAALHETKDVPQEIVDCVHQ